MADLFNESDEKFYSQNARCYLVTPNLPENLKPLLEIAYNLWWAWNSHAVELFRRMDRELWEKVYHNPIKLLGMISQERLAALSSDNSFISHMERTVNDFRRYMKLQTWYQTAYPDAADCQIAYFSAEFGLHESLPIYAGGLGILSGDHLKSAGDLGVPLVGVGLLYRYGYFHQYLNIDGWQQEEMRENHFSKMPVIRVRDDKGKPVTISIEIPMGRVLAQLWKINIGRATLILLDTDINENSESARRITYELYGGDMEMRILQEILLGIGGFRALRVLNYNPTVFHMNEGHSAFLSIERMRYYVEENNLSFEEAKEIVTASTVFTTHTPVPAGNDVFPVELIDKYFEQYYKNLKITREKFLSLGRINPSDQKEPFSMPVLAFRTSSRANGVSRLHGAVSRKMWKDLWPGLNRSEIPITHITNGIHANTWISYEMASLFDRYIGTVWKDEPANQKIWESVANIPDAEIWRSHERRRERLVEVVRARLKAQLIRRGAHRNVVLAADEALDPEALTIGFARRFATYKRATLIFRDLGRLKNILNKKDMPVQIIIAGKAHPKDNNGKEFIKQIIHMSRDPELRDKVVFIEDYDMNIAHYMVQGVDIWLNNPRRPLEASGTSGMKAAVNGVLNLSILDGWWCEGYDGNNGWVIGSGEEYTDTEYQDEVESKAIYDLLEREIIPLFYNRGPGGLPREWVKKMKDSMRSICPIFNTNRMVEEYTRKFYMPAHLDFSEIIKNNFEKARARAGWLGFLYQNWKDIKIISVKDTISGELKINDTFEVEARIRLAALKPDDVRVEVFWGYVDSRGGFSAENIVGMNLTGKVGDGEYTFKTSIKADKIGHCGYILRILPNSDNNNLKYAPGLIIWQ